MATVVNVPRDTRFGDLGRGLGDVVGIALAARRAKKADENKTKAVDEVFNLLADPAKEPSRAEAHSILQQGGFDPGESVDLTESLFKARERQKEFDFQRTQQERGFEHDEEQLTRELGSREKTAAAQRRVTREEGEADRAVRRELAKFQVGARREEGQLEREHESEEAARTREHQLKLEREKAETRAATQGKATITLFDEQGRERDIVVPKGFGEAEIDAYIEGLKETRKELEGFSRVKPTDKPKPTETDKDVAALSRDLVKDEDIPELRGKDPNDREVLDAARRIKRIAPSVQDGVVDHYSEVVENQATGVSQRVWGPGQENRLKANHAVTQIHRIIAGGESDPGVAQAEAIKRAEEWWNNFGYVPKDVRETKDGTFRYAAILTFGRMQLGMDESELRRIAKDKMGLTDEQFEQWLDRIENAPVSGRKVE